MPCQRLATIFCCLAFLDLTACVAPCDRETCPLTTTAADEDEDEDLTTAGASTFSTTSTTGDDGTTAVGSTEPAPMTVYCADQDRDWFGDPNDCVESPFHPGLGWVDDSSDCDDTRDFVFPGAAERDDPEACMEDADDDGHGASDPSAAATTPGHDCDDASARTYPGAAPLDDLDACMKDQDRDYYGDAAPPSGVAPGSDCADDVADAHANCEPCAPSTKHCGALDELWVCNESGTAYTKLDCAGLCNALTLTCLGALSVSLDPPSVCVDDGDSIPLDPLVKGGTGLFSWIWSPEELLDDAAKQTPLATTMWPTTFTVTVSDGLATAHADVTVLIDDTGLALDPTALPIYSWSGVMGTTPAWVWDPMTEETCQVADARASALVSDFVLDHARVTARMRVGTADDDDFVGLVFGAQDDAHFYLASWKQTAQAFCDQTVVPAGITIKRIAADAPEDITCADLHNPHDTPRSTLLVAASEVHDVGWKSGVEYLWEIVHLGELMTLRVRAAASQAVIAETTFVDGAYPRGAVGVFASSQAEACFTDVRTTCVD